jgi:hypothetical protein
MPMIVLDSSTIENLAAVLAGAEVRDERGALIGCFHPAGTPATSEPRAGPRPEAELLRRTRRS